jgi:protocatechuate 3,4-dioxygenase beta subunit/polyisoprenoid-binding protein YceI
VQYVIVPEESEARYRITEQLANLSLPNDAVGVTRQISGAVVLNLDGSIDTANSQLTVNLASIASDRGNRDNYVRRNVLKTDQYPNAVFVPAAVTGLPSPLPESGEVNFQVTGDLTLLTVTRPVTWNVTGTINGDQAVGQATTSFTFADFNLTKPSVPIVLSVEDEIRLEVDVTLRREGGQASSPASIPATGAADASGAPDCTSPSALTPAATEGPYYMSGAPQTSNLYQAGMGGTQLTLSGYVLTSECQPVANARVDFWQADAQGQYDNRGYTLRGYQLTGADGRYQLVTVIPGQYPGRTEHLHVKVQAPGGPELTTQLYFPEADQNQRDRIFDASLLVKNLSDTATGGKTATFDFVLSSAP